MPERDHRTHRAGAITLGSALTLTALAACGTSSSDEGGGSEGSSGSSDPAAPLNFLACPWEADRLRRTIDDTLAVHAPVGAPATWVLCNHDVPRTVTRYGRDDTGFDFAKKAFATPTASPSGPGGPGRSRC